MTAPVAPVTATRDAATVTAWNLVSRVTGLVRVLVLAGALGATRLGDTYQASNQVSNVLFEFLAAGTLSAVLVPGLVRVMATGDGEEARAFAGATLGRILVVLVPLVVVGVALTRPIAELLFAGNHSSTHDAQVHLGAVLLLFVLPQVLLYAWGAVVTALLHAAGRFASAAIAPVANNVVVTLGLGLFWYRGATGVALGDGDTWLLGSAALGGVVAMSLVPVLAAARAGLWVTPRLRASAPTGVARDALWGSLVLIPAQLVAFGSLLVAGRVAGGVAAYQIAFSFFLLPHALLGHPTATVLYPRLAAAHAHDDDAAARRMGAGGLEFIVVGLGGAAALAAALAPWLVRVVEVGALQRGDGAELTAAALAGLAVGLPGYAMGLFLTRVAYAGGDVRLPAFAAIAGGLLAAVVLMVALAVEPGRRLVVVVALAHSVMVWVATAWMVVGNVTAGRLPSALPAVARAATAALTSAATAYGAASLLPDGGGRMAALLVTVVAGIVGVVAYAGSLAVLGQRTFPRLVGDA